MMSWSYIGNLSFKYIRMVELSKTYLKDYNLAHVLQTQLRKWYLLKKTLLDARWLLALFIRHLSPRRIIIKYRSKGAKIFGLSHACESLGAILYKHPGMTQNRITQLISGFWPDFAHNEYLYMPLIYAYTMIFEC